MCYKACCRERVRTQGGYCDDEACHISHRNYLRGEVSPEKTAANNLQTACNHCSVGASTYYSLKDYYSALPYFRVQFVLPIQLSTIHLYPPVVVEYPQPQSCVMSVNCTRLYTSFSTTITETGNVEKRMNFNSSGQFDFPEGLQWLDCGGCSRERRYFCKKKKKKKKKKEKRNSDMK